MSEEKKHSISITDIDFENIAFLGKYTTGTGKILPRKLTGLNAKQQRHLSRSIKRSRSLLLMK